MEDDLETFRLAETIYKNHESKLALLEKRRIGHVWFLLGLSLVALVASFLIAAFSIPFIGHFMPPLTFFTVFFVCFAGFLSISYPALDRDYRRKAKHFYMQLMAKSLKLSYRPCGFIKLGSLYEHQILPPYTTHRVEEGFRGKYRDFEIEFQDFRIRPVKRFSFFDYRSYLKHHSLKGLLIRIHLNKHLNHHTVLIPSFMTHSFMKRTLHKKFKSHEDINFVYRKFKRRYTVLSTQAVEAHYVLDPAVIERIMKLGELLDAKWVEMSFRDREFVIYAQHAKNFFEIGHLLRPVNVLTIEESLLEMKSLREILNVMELNPYAGLGASVPIRDNTIQL